MAQTETGQDDRTGRWVQRGARWAEGQRDPEEVYAGRQRLPVPHEMYNGQHQAKERSADTHSRPYRMLLYVEYAPKLFE